MFLLVSFYLIGSLFAHMLTSEEEEEDDSEEESGMSWDELEEQAKKGLHGDID